MQQKRISYITLISDLYMLLFLSYHIYSYFYGYERIGRESYRLASISNNIALTIGILETVLCLVFAYLLHKCHNYIVRRLLMLICLINIIYRVINILYSINIFNIFMILLNILIYITLVFYKRNANS